jgi:predicted enzyme related to lactoylglutathione lyase
MGIAAKYVHTNLVAEDWQTLARFYQQLFGAVPVPPERDFQGEALEAGTGIPSAHLRGIHLRLPGCGDDGPTLEIFSYNILGEKGDRSNLCEAPCGPFRQIGPVPFFPRPGFGHIAFSVDDVAAARQAVLQAGGHAVGQIVTLQTASGANVTWCYVTDPEGNIIELQSWSETE